VTHVQVIGQTRISQGFLLGHRHIGGHSGELVMEPGPVEVSAGSSSSDIRSSAKFTVTGKKHAISGAERAFFSVVTASS
jgi:hypothetical protein